MKYSTRPKNARDRSPQVKRSPQLPEASQSIAGREYSTSLHSSCAASTDYHRTAYYSDCESTATIGAFIIVSTANFLCSCGRPTACDFQTDDFQPTFSCTFTTGGESAKTLLDYPVSSQLFPVCLYINRWTHHSHFHPLNFTSTVTSAIFHSS